MQPSELQRLRRGGRIYLQGFIESAREIMAREKWDFINLIGLAFADPKDADTSEMKIALAMAAYASDEKSMAIALEAVTRDR